MCAKLRTVAASNNRDHASQSLLLLLACSTIHIFVLHAHPVRGESHNQRNTTREGCNTINQTDSFIITVIAVKTACTCKLLQLLPDRCMVQLIIELVGNRSLILYHRQQQPEQVTAHQEQHATRICPVTPSTSKSLICQPSFRESMHAHANSLAIMHADGD